MRLPIGQQAPEFTLHDITGKTISLRDYANKKLLLCFFRYAGCPFCELSFLRLLRHYGQFSSQELSIISFFQSPQKAVIKHIGKYRAPFPVIADPQKTVYNLYQIESNLMGWPRTAAKTPGVIGDMIKNRIFQGKIDGDPNLIPAYFLIGPPELTLYQTHYSENFLNDLCMSDIEDFVSKV